MTQVHACDVALPCGGVEGDPAMPPDRATALFYELFGGLP